jgi:hypothetical protein
MPPHQRREALKWWQHREPYMGRDLLSGAKKFVDVCTKVLFAMLKGD